MKLGFNHDLKADWLQTSTPSPLPVFIPNDKTAGGAHTASAGRYIVKHHGRVAHNIAHWEAMCVEEELKNKFSLPIKRRICATWAEERNIINEGKKTHCYKSGGTITEVRGMQLNSAI